MAVVFFLIGLLSFGSVPVIYRYEIAFYQQHEAYFKSPISNTENHLFIRSDAYGKGYFGAPRSGERKHEGVDFYAPLDSPILASKSGRIIAANYDPSGFGNYVEILHAGAQVTRYAHLNSIQTRAGEWIKQDAPLGTNGKTGNAKNPQIKPHLHFEIRQSGSPVDPKTLLDPNLTYENL